MDFKSFQRLEGDDSYTKTDNLLKYYKQTNMKYKIGDKVTLPKGTIFNTTKNLNLNKPFSTISFDLNLVIKGITSDYYELEEDSYKGGNFFIVKFTDMPNQEEKVIVGWKLKEEFKIQEKEIARLSKQDNDQFGSYSFGEAFTNNCITERLYRELKTLELWFDPIYEEEIKSKKLELGSPKRQFTIYKDKIEVVDGEGSVRRFTKKEVDGIQSLYKRVDVVQGYDIKVSQVQIGCQYGVALTAEDVLLLKQTQNSL